MPSAPGQPATTSSTTAANPLAPDATAISAATVDAAWRNRESVSTRRTYVSELRQEQAATTRDRVIRAAAELFAEKGYAGTTMPAIARRARVSTETVQNHGPKIQLLRAAIAATSFGGTPGGPVADTELGRQLVAGVDTPAAAAQAGASVLATINEGAHGVWVAFSEASRSDPALAAELRTLTEEIAVQTRVTLQGWERRGWLRTDLTPEILVRRTTAIASVELWDRIVRTEGSSREEYVELVAGMLLDLLIDPDRRRSSSTADEFAGPEESNLA